MSENDMAKIARLVADPHADARAEVQGLLVEHERLTLELIATRARVAQLEAALTAAYHALESYAHDNASTELAVSIAAHCKAALKDAPQ